MCAILLLFCLSRMRNAVRKVGRGTYGAAHPKNQVNIRQFSLWCKYRKKIGCGNYAGVLKTSRKPCLVPHSKKKRQKVTCRRKKMVNLHCSWQVGSEKGLVSISCRAAEVSGIIRPGVFDGILPPCDKRLLNDDDPNQKYKTLPAVACLSRTAFSCHPGSPAGRQS